MPAIESSDYKVYLQPIYDALRELVKDPGNWSEETDLAAQVNLSSLQVMELIEILDDELDISIPLNVLPDVRTIGDLARKLSSLNS